MQNSNIENVVFQKKFLGLDAIRTLAIAGVTFFHMFPDKIKGGYLGVSLFFVLTGFLLAYTTSAQSAFNVRAYYCKRIKRIYPELMVMLLGTIGVYSFLLPNVVAGVFEEMVSILLGYNNWWQILQNADYFARITNSSPFTHLWFLGIELQYYFIWPVLYLLYKALKKNVGLLVFVLMGLASAGLMMFMYNPEMDVTRLYYGTDTRIYALLFGAVIGLMASENKYIELLPTKTVSKTLLVIAVLITLVTYVVMGGQSSLTYQGGMVAMTILFCFMLYLVIATDLGAALENPLLKFFSKYSYGIFLWQYPVIYLFEHKPWGNMPGSAFLQLLLICALAVWSKHFTDSIMNRVWPFSDSKLMGCKKLVFGVAAIVTAGFMIVGAKTFVCSYGYQDIYKAELQARLEANAKKLAAENAAAEKAAHEQAVNLAKGQVDLRGVVCIGDSVMLGSSDALRKVLPNCYIDAAVSRYVSDGVKVAEDLEAKGKLGHVVLIHLGTNGPIAGSERYEVHTKKLLEVLGPDRDIFWVNFYCPETTWQDTNNAYLSNIICGYHSNVHLVNWYELVHDKPELLVADRIHPNNKGMEKYSELVRETLVKVLAEQSVNKAKKESKNR